MTLDPELTGDENGATEWREAVLSSWADDLWDSASRMTECPG